MHELTQHPQINAALGRARRRWLNSATINAGGRWAVLPAAAAALVGLVLAMSGVREVWALSLVAAVGFAGVIAALVLTRNAFARPGRDGAPDYTLALDRALGLDDALPALVESPGAFSGPLASRVANALDPVREKQAAPARHFAPLIVGCILCLLPLAALTPDALPNQGEGSQPHKVAGNPDERPAPVPPARADVKEEGNPEEGNDGPGQGAGKGQKGPDGNPLPEPGGGGGEAPKDKPKPDPFAKPPQHQPSGAGDKLGPPPQPPEETPEPEIDTKDTPLTPEAGDGETRKELRKRWLYDPNGAPLPGAQPNVPRMESKGEAAIPRQKITSNERKALEQLYEKLYR